MADDDGTIDIKATQSGSFSTSAKSVSEGMAKNLGVGCAIAIAITGSDVTAKIADGVQILNESGGDAVLSSVDLLSKYSGKEQIKSNAGAKGGKSIVPVLSLIVSGVAVESTFGAGNMVDRITSYNVCYTKLLRFKTYR